MIFGTVDYELDDSRSTEIYKVIAEERLPVSNMCSKHGRLSLTVAYELSGSFEREMRERGIELNIIRRRGLCAAARRILKKKGLLLGSAVSCLVLFFMSFNIFSFEILNDSPDVRQDIMSVLDENGISAGMSVRDIDLTVVERDLKYRVSGISWAGISVKGCKMIIDTVDNIPKPEFTQTRLPTNLVARENGVIEKVELTDGLLMKTIGSGVAKGDIIVSGNVVTDRVYYRGGVERHDIHQRYARSIGKVYGTFERTFKVFQPYSKTEKILSGRTEEKGYISLFDSIIPLYFGNSENYTCRNAETHTPKLFGLELPISYTRETLDEYSFKEVPLSAEEALAEAKAKVDAYEYNFLREFELKKRDISEEKDENGVTLTVKYSLYGVISEEVEFFVDK